ncbi:rhodanese-like domain-containing protein [Bacteroidota bacterium]
MKTLTIVLACVAGLFFAQKFMGATSEQDKLVKNVGVKEFQELIINNENGVLIDVRTPNEISQGYIKGAVFIDFYDKNFESNVLKIAKDKEIFLYCRSGGRSGNAAKILVKNGYEKVYNLSGGFNAWSANKLPIAK